MFSIDLDINKINGKNKLKNKGKISMIVILSLIKNLKSICLLISNQAKKKIILRVFMYSIYLMHSEYAKVDDLLIIPWLLLN